MQNHGIASAVADHIENATADQLRPSDGSAIRKPHAGLWLQGSREMPFRVLGSMLAEEKDVVLCEEKKERGLFVCVLFCSGPWFEKLRRRTFDCAIRRGVEAAKGFATAADGMELLEMSGAQLATEQGHVGEFWWVWEEDAAAGSLVVVMRSLERFAPVIPRNGASRDGLIR